MPDSVIHGLELLVRLLEIVGAGTLTLGFVVATTCWVLGSRRKGGAPAGAEYRKALGRVVLIGLEILVAATIVKTIAFEPSLESVGQLAAMVVIRTLLGWTMVLEIYGRWPWQKPGADAAS